MKYIHLDCLKLWIKSKIVTKESNFLVIHTFKPIDCEICKSDIPERIKIKDHIFSIIEFQKPDENYIILECLTKDNYQDFIILYIIHMRDKNNVKIVSYYLT